MRRFLLNRFPLITLGQGSVESWFMVINVKQIYIESLSPTIFLRQIFFFLGGGGVPNLISIAGCISSTISTSISLQERFDLLGCTNRGWWLYNSATIRGFCYESSARWLLWDTAVQDFCVYWWTHICGRGELLLNFLIILSLSLCVCVCVCVGMHHRISQKSADLTRWFSDAGLCLALLGPVQGFIHEFLTSQI